jgi:cytoskeletal protein CcmA (bactofilin family)
MWRKNQESQPPAPVPAVLPNKTEMFKNEPAKSESNKPLAANPEAGKPEVAQAPVATPAAVPVAAAAPSPAPFTPAPAPVSYAPSASPSPLASSADSRIGSGLKIRGEITGTSDMYIDGNVEGKVRIGSGRLTVGANGRVQADLEAREIFVNGSVVGNLKATDRVQLGSSGSVQGGVVTPRIGIDDGARLRGNVETARASDSSSAPAPVEKEKARVLVAAKGE